MVCVRLDRPHRNVHQRPSRDPIDRALKPTDWPYPAAKYPIPARPPTTKLTGALLARPCSAPCWASKYFSSTVAPVTNGATVAWQNATVYFGFRSFLCSDLVLSSMMITPAASTIFLSRSIPVRMTLCSPTDRVLVST